LADYIYVCAAQVFAALQSRVSWNSVRYSWSSSRPAVVRISVSANPGVHRCWRCVDHDRDRRADRRLRRELTPRDAPGTLDLNKLVHRSGGGIGRALLPRSDEARQRGAERLTILADRTQRASTSATTGCGSAGRPRTPVPGRLLTRGDPDLGALPGSADPNINRRSGGSASLPIP
jgi:hypothetical protein